jgi:hypothetical protein
MGKFVLLKQKEMATKKKASDNTTGSSLEN